LSDVFMAMERRGDFATAERLGLEFGEDFRLRKVKRLRSGGLDGLVLGYMRQHKQDGPVRAPKGPGCRPERATASTVSLASKLRLRCRRSVRSPWRQCWPEDYRQEFVLTMPVHDLTEVLKRLKGEAEHLLLGSEREAGEQEAESTRRFQLGYHACEALLANLDQREGESA
jgi:hypothetical protein